MVARTQTARGIPKGPSRERTHLINPPSEDNPEKHRTKTYILPSNEELWAKLAAQDANEEEHRQARSMDPEYTDTRTTAKHQEEQVFRILDGELKRILRPQVETLATHLASTNNTRTPETEREWRRQEADLAQSVLYHLDNAGRIRFGRNAIHRYRELYLLRPQSFMHYIWAKARAAAGISGVEASRQFDEELRQRWWAAVPDDDNKGDFESLETTFDKKMRGLGAMMPTYLIESSGWGL